MPALAVDRIGQKIARITLGAATEYVVGPITIGSTPNSTFGRAVLLVVPAGADASYHSASGQVATDGISLPQVTGRMIPIQDQQTFYLYSTAGTTVDILVYGW